MSNDEDKFGDRRMKKDAGVPVRGSRDSADDSRVNYDGGSLTAEERRRMLRRESIQESLPTPPPIPGFHLCWLSTTNSYDPIFKRVKLGYTPVKASEVQGFGGAQLRASGGEFDGCVACNEMVLFKIPMQVYQDLMMIYHHDMPKEQEETIKDNVMGKREFDSNGRELGIVEGDFGNLGREIGNQSTSFI